jgi:hypothetical protein
VGSQQGGQIGGGAEIKQRLDPNGGGLAQRAAAASEEEKGHLGGFTLAAF